MIIDSHQHALSDTGAQISISKSAGIDRVYLFPTRVHPENSRNFAEFTSELSRLMTNLGGGKLPVDEIIDAIDATASIVETAPDYFTGFGICPAGLGESETAAWIETHITEKGLSGIGEVTFASGNTASIENMIRYTHDSGKKLPVWIHTFNPAAASDIREIITLSDRYPRARIILGHGGGYHWCETLTLAKERRNIWIDLSAQFSIFPVKYYAQEIPDRILFSSDLPYDDPALRIDMLKKIITDKIVLARALGANAAELVAG